MMAGGDNADGKWSEKKVEGEDGLRTVECLRGRLLAERASSRIAKENADQIGIKLVDLENKLKAEIKSRNRAEKRLKFLMKKMESLNLPYVSEDSEHSSSLEKSDITSVSSSSTASSPPVTKQPEEDQEPKSQTTNPEKCDLENNNLKQNASDQCHDNSSSSIEGNSNSTEKSNQSELSQNFADSRRDDQSVKSSIIEEKIEENGRGQGDYVDNALALGGDKIEENGRGQGDYVDNALALGGDKIEENDRRQGDYVDNALAVVGEKIEENDGRQGDYVDNALAVVEDINEENDRNQGYCVDNSLALVVIDPPVASKKIEIPITDESVQAVLEALRNVKGKLQSTMERRRHTMIKVGSR